jgi:hypothetical protein
MTVKKKEKSRNTALDHETGTFGGKAGSTPDVEPVLLSVGSFHRMQAIIAK